MTDLSTIRSQMRAHHQVADDVILKHLTSKFAPSEPVRARAVTKALALVDRVRDETTPDMMEAFLTEYGLSSDEGVAVMTLAEALLRVPDAATKDALIEDKTTARAWLSHAGKSANIAVNASTLALSATGTILADTKEASLLRRATKRVGAPVIRQAVGRVMQVLGHQFVLGETIEDATNRARQQEAKGYTYSYDMLGEAAMTAADAQTFFDAYKEAINHIGAKSEATTVAESAGISIKLSALFHRYEFLQRDAVMAHLVPRVLELCNLAANYNIGLNIDAEEADRLDLSLDVIEAVLSSPDLEGWDGFGVVVQAYGKRASWVIDWLHALATKLDRKIMVRLVKGAYWDTEIKAAQVQGLAGYPVFSTKQATDVSYICCAQQLLSHRDRIYPQFATHNAHTVAAVMECAGNTSGFEFQRLHGMGEALYDVLRGDVTVPCRIYAPVGSHKELLAYLVRRLLENGANSSFVHQIADEDIPSTEIIKDPFEASTATKIPLPDALYAPERRNSEGLNIQNVTEVEALEAARAQFLTTTWHAEPIVVGPPASSEIVKIVNPADHSDVVGTVGHASPETVDQAVVDAAPWTTTADVKTRADVLNKAADLYEANLPEFAALLAREAGKTLMDVIAEMREAVDFLRYYAAQAAHHPDTKAKGILAAISPWNFPLAIFTGQISAGLATGNAVLAKPAEATPLTAALAVRLMHQAGVPVSALQLLPGYGATVGAQLSADPRIDGMCFTGSTETAQRINRSMADHLSPSASLLAETGGLNAMVVDSTALPEQAVRDMITSAFQSAGQRCSALRVLYLQDDVADTVLTMLTGAMDALCVGTPLECATDIGPVIDAKAKETIEDHISRHQNRILKQLPTPEGGTFVAPTLIELDGIHQLDKEIFGPVLHVCRFKAKDLAKVLNAINATGFGLTFGLHSRIGRRTEEVAKAIHAGNIYINRNQIGAVVGSQPFGGEGLSGTGPKAGGPNYLTQFLKGASTPKLNGSPLQTTSPKVAQEMIDAAAARPSEVSTTLSLPGPTGEDNMLTISGRGVVLCLGPGEDASAEQARLARLNGAQPVVLSCDVEALGTLTDFEAVAHWGDASDQRRIRQTLAAREGKIIPLLATAYALKSFVREQHVCTDTTAAGGNAALLAGEKVSESPAT